MDTSKLKDLISRSNCTIIEVGANDGTDTAKFLDIVRYGHIFAFEPDPRAIQRFRTNVISNQVHLIECALGSQVGMARFYQSSGLWPFGEELRIEQNLPTDWDQSGSTRKPKKHLEKHPWVSFEHEIEVPMTTLDQWTEENSIRLVDLLWADVQGAENDLITGALNTLKLTRFFYTEFSEIELYDGAPRLEDISERLPDFDLIGVYGENALYKNKLLSNLL